MEGIDWRRKRAKTSLHVRVLSSSVLAWDATASDPSAQLSPACVHQHPSVDAPMVTRGLSCHGLSLAVFLIAQSRQGRMAVKRFFATFFFFFFSPLLPPWWFSRLLCKHQWNAWNFPLSSRNKPPTPFFFNLWRGNDKIYVCCRFLENY